MKAESTFIVRPKTLEQENALKAFIEALKINFEITTMEEIEFYDPEFVKKIKRGEEQLKNGKGMVIKTEDLWK
ncbi:MAG TPA: DUF2683 family protein [Salinimicrobium sp.]|nr:DUF2683 family protein [Salinimicrobium sp.]